MTYFPGTYISGLLDTVSDLGIVPGHPCLYDAIRTVCRNVAPPQYLEIGVNDGASTLAVLDSSSPVPHRLTLADSWGGIDGGLSKGSHEHIDRLLSTVGYRGSVRYLDGDSRITIPSLDASDLYSLVLIDGDHSYSGCAADLHNAWPHVAPGGVLILDDWERRHIKQAFDDFVISLAGQSQPMYRFETKDETNETLVVGRQS